METLQQTQISKEGELVKMKINMAEQELNLMEEQVRWGGGGDSLWGLNGIVIELNFIAILL